MKFHRIAVAATLALASLAPALAAPTLSITPSQQHIAIGDFATVNIVISGLSGINELVTGYDLNVVYNAGLLNWASIELGPGANALGGAGNVVFGFDPTAGAIGGDVTSLLTNNDDLDALQGDTFTLMTLIFAGIDNGASQLKFGPDDDFDRLVTGRLDSLGIAGVLDLNYVGACISVGTGSCNTVPEPTSYGLAGLALLGCGLATTRRRRAGAPAAA